MPAPDDQLVQEAPMSEAAESTAPEVHVQAAGFLLELSADWLILRASENVHKHLGEYHVRLIGEPLADFTLAQPLHDLRNSLARQTSHTGIARAYRVRLIDEPRYFDIAFQQVGGRILLEGLPAAEEGLGSAYGSISRMIDGMAELDRASVLENAARRMRALTGFDSVMLTIGDERTESSRGPNLHDAADDAAALAPLLIDAASAPVPLFPRTSDGVAASKALLRAPLPEKLDELRKRGVRSMLNLPISDNDGRLGGFSCASTTLRAPTLELHAATELFAQIFALHLRDIEGR